MTLANMGDALLNYEDVARLLGGCCVKHVRDRYVKTDMLPVVRVGRLVRFRLEDVQRLIRRLMGEE